MNNAFSTCNLIPQKLRGKEKMLMPQYDDKLYEQYIFQYEVLVKSAQIGKIEHPLFHLSTISTSYIRTLRGGSNMFYFNPQNS